MSDIAHTAWLPDLIYVDYAFQTGVAIVCDDQGRIVRLIGASEASNARRLTGMALLPGMVNAHSHAFQRVIRGRTEYKTQNSSDSFWTWRDLMYRAAAALTPEDVYDASRMTFLEMVLSGITTVGEFHYLHNDSSGQPYDDPSLLAKQVIRAARDTGLRIALLRVAYARAGFQQEINPRQARFLETEPNQYLKNTELLIADIGEDEFTWLGIAPHSVRALPLDYLRQIVRFGMERRLPIHMHVAEQPAEVSACIEEYGRSPVALLETEGLLSDRFTAVHAIHVTAKAAWMLGQTGALVCACPTTERNLGDGIVPVDEYFRQRLRVSLGTDSQAQIDLLEDARELEYHLRLQKLQRTVLAIDDDTTTSALAARLFTCATKNAADSLAVHAGVLEVGAPADFFTVNLSDPTLAGASKDDLLSCLVFSSSRATVQDVVVGGVPVVTAGTHSEQESIVERFSNLQRRLWSEL